MGARIARRTPVILTVAVGLLASAAGAYLFYDGETARAHLALDYRAEWRLKDLEEKIKATGDPIGGLATFLATEIANGVQITPERFTRWAAIRNDYAGTTPRAYLWWPFSAAPPNASEGGLSDGGRTTPAATAGFQAPVVYLTKDGSLATDADESETQRSTQREALIRAWFSGGVRISRPYGASGWPKSQNMEFLYAAPVYQGGHVPATIAERQTSLLGVVGATFSLRDVLDAAIRGTPRMIEAIYLSEQPWPAHDERSYFGRYDPDANRFLLDGGLVRPADLDGIVIAKRLETPGLNWYLLFQFSPAEIGSTRTPGPWLFLFSGVILTAAAAGYVQRSLARREQLAAAVSMSDARLRRTHRELEAVIRSSPAAIVCIDNARSVTVWNAAAERLFGLPAIEAVGRRYRPPPRAEGGGDGPDLGLAIAEGRMIDGMAKLGAGAGDRRSVAVRSATLVGDHGEPLGAVYVASDVTDLLLLEHQLRQAQKMEAVGQLTGGVAHDFNNLLGVIIGNLDLIGNAFEGNPKKARLLDSALRAALRGADLTRALLAFARRQPLTPAAVTLNPLIGHLCQLLGPTLGETVEIVLELQPDLWPVHIDAVQLESAITNLAINARDALSGGGRLLIATRNTHIDASYAAQDPDLTAGDYVVIEVSDTGHGMTPEILERVFEPFFTTKEEGKGTGLGLPMVYGFVKQSAGHIKIYSEVGRGTTVRIYLPRLAGAPDAPAERNEALPAAKGSETVLIVEDNVDLRHMVAGQLQALGYRTVEAENGQQALEIVTSGTPVDLLFSDVIMAGGINGLDLVREVHRRRPAVKLLLTSGFPGAMSAREREISPGLAISLLTKPYRREELARQIRSTLDQRL